MSLINTQVQPFKTQAFHNGKFIEVSDLSVIGYYLTEDKLSNQFQHQPLQK